MYLKDQAVFAKSNTVKEIPVGVVFQPRKRLAMQLMLMKNEGKGIMTGNDHFMLVRCGQNYSKKKKNQNDGRYW